MKTNRIRCFQQKSATGMTQGFTLIELLIAMVVGSIALGAIFATYVNVSETFAVQRDLADMQQNMRAAMFLIKDDLRNSGRNGDMDGTVGIDGIIKYNPDTDDATGYPGILMSSLVDTDLDGQAEPGQERWIEYRVFDAEGDGRRELRRRVTDVSAGIPVQTNWQLVVDGIEDIGFAYAFDRDNDLDLDRSAGAVIWAIDTDGDNTLDTNVDTNADGDVNAADDTNGDGVINATDGAATSGTLNDIRAVRIWLLGRSIDADPDYLDNHTYVVGHKVINMTDAAYANRRNFHHYLLDSAIALPNHQWRN